MARILHELPSEVDTLTSPEMRQAAPILVADHDELVRWSVAERLKEHGYAVVVATSAREALQRCPTSGVALLDCGLSGEDGLAMAARLLRRHSRCRIVLTTVDPTPDLRFRARDLGVAQVLGRPFSLDILAATIRDLVGPGPTRRAHRH